MTNSFFGGIFGSYVIPRRRSYPLGNTHKCQFFWRIREKCSLFAKLLAARSAILVFVDAERSSIRLWFCTREVAPTGFLSLAKSKITTPSRISPNILLSENSTKGSKSSTIRCSLKNVCLPKSLTEVADFVETLVQKRKFKIRLIPVTLRF